ncbi:MAG TPA: YpjP family protein [Pseudogracilibacillus sp.]|nr:YpjP family protein [Pseudogracilibacillus sp.]
MKLWMRKLFVSLIAILTLGIYIPETILEADETNEQDTYIPSNTSDVVIDDHTTSDLEEHSVLEELTAFATKQTVHKLGPKILKQLDDEFHSVIMPSIEVELEKIFSSFDEEMIAYYKITENPSPGYGERIFNITNEMNGDTIAKFHVRRDYKPLEGYWFNFHYHLASDHFETHHVIADVFWDKNTPPKWMSS